MFSQLHPLIVHLPIGCILMASICTWFFRDQRKVISLTWFLASCSAALACLTGYLRSTAQDGYDPDLVQLHQYLNISITIVCIGIWWLSRGAFGSNTLAVAGLFPSVMVAIGTYSGASLTHGSDFLTKDIRVAVGNDESAFMPAVDLPTTTVQAANNEAITKARQAGLSVMPVGEESHWLSVSSINYEGFSDQDMALLTPLAEQIVWLRLTDSKITDQGMAVLSRMKNLTRLYLDNTNVQGSGLAALTGLEHLSLLSLSGTKIDLDGFGNLPVLPVLKKVFLFKTPICGTSIADIITKYAPTILDTGGYKLPILEGDTSELKAKKSY
jgi:uncharacterized membrane protein